MLVDDAVAVRVAVAVLVPAAVPVGVLVAGVPVYLYWRREGRP